MTTMEDKNGQSEIYSFQNTQPVQVMKQVSDMVVLPHVTDKSCHCIKNRLEPVQQVAMNAKQGCAAITVQHMWLTTIQLHCNWGLTGMQ